MKKTILSTILAATALFATGSAFAAPDNTALTRSQLAGIAARMSELGVSFTVTDGTAEQKAGIEVSVKTIGSFQDFKNWRHGIDAVLLAMPGQQWESVKVCAGQGCGKNAATYALLTPSAGNYVTPKAIESLDQLVAIANKELGNVSQFKSEDGKTDFEFNVPLSANYDSWKSLGALQTHISADGKSRTVKNSAAEQSKD